MGSVFWRSDSYIGDSTFSKFNSLINIVLLTMTIGIVLFSFSIYMLTIQSIIDLSLNFLGIITPIGGVLLIVSWILLLFSIKK